ncbi:MAG: DMT family transporter [Kordiimonadaceae bacterium]|nr:DMT family transporter [Kordiimonadaceae bacterium]
MIKPALLYALWAATAGALIPVMAAMNGRLGKTIGNAPYSVLALFIIAIAGAAIYVFVSKAPLPSLTLIAKAPPIYFTGGLIVLFYVISVTILTPQFGVANTIFFVVVAQIVSATVIDHFGLFGVDIRTLGLKRTLGILMLIAGVILARAAPASGEG